VLLKMTSASELQKLNSLLLNSRVSGNIGSYFLVFGNTNLAVTLRDSDVALVY